MGENLGEGVRGSRPPAVLVEKARLLTGVQTSMVAIVIDYCNRVMGFVYAMVVCERVNKYECEE